MKLRELWRLSSILYKEVSFQSIFSLRTGAALPRRGNADVRRLMNNAKMSTLISKIITSVFIAVFGFTVLLPLSIQMGTSHIARALAIVGGVTAFLSSVLFLIIFMGLQVSTSFISSKTVEILSPLPLSRRDISNTVFLCFTRIFDLPLITAVVVFVSAYTFYSGSLLGGLIVLVSVIVTEIFALSLTIGLAKFFYSRVSGAGGRSKWKALLRLVFMVLWVLPSLGTYLVLDFATQIIESFASLAQIFSSYLNFLVLVYPFSYGFLVSFTTFFSEANYLSLELSIISFFGYLILGIFSLRWVTGAIRKLGTGGTVHVVREIVKDTLIRTQSSWLGIIRKDLRVASRAPSYASLFLLPTIQTIVLVLSFSSLGNIGLSVTFGILTGMSIVTLMLPPTLFSIEGVASAYSRSLPLRKRTLIFSKAILSTLTYLISLAVLFVVATFLGKDFATILVFGAIHALSVASGSMVELKLLANKFWKEGFSLGNIYARLTTYILIVLPGLITLFLPLAAAMTTYVLAEELTLTVFFIVALLEYGIVTMVALRAE